jgi:hypothetical protein
MNKKGLSHIDWVISFGVFVIFVLLLFIWFGPSLTTEFSDEYLGEIASQGFKDASYHEVYNYPIFFEVGSDFNNGRIEINGMESLGINDENISLIDDSGNVINGLRIVGDVLKFQTSVSFPGIYSYNMYISDYFTNAHTSGSGGFVAHNATLGVGERLYGFSSKRFEDLSLLDYVDFKDELNYPSNRDVSVYVYDSLDFSTILYDYNVSEPTENDNVYVVSWSDLLINETGGMEHITVLVKTW